MRAAYKERIKELLKEFGFVFYQTSAENLATERRLNKAEIENVFKKSSDKVVKPDYEERLKELFPYHISVENFVNENESSEHRSLYNKIKNHYKYVRDVIVEIGAYLPRFVLGATNRIKIWMRYDDSDVLDHELWHMEGLDEYRTQAAMVAGRRPDRSKWNIIKRFAGA